MRIPEDAIPAVAFIFERERGASLSAFESAEISKHGLEGISPALLVRELCNLIRTEHKADSHDRQMSYWALGKRNDRELLPFLRGQLALELGRDVAAAYQILIALDNLGEACFDKDRSGSYSANDHELNLRDGQSYLSRLIGSSSGG